MKKGSMITQWIFGVLFGICTFGNGFHWSSLLLLMGTLLMLPIPAIRNFFNGLKLKNRLIITLAVIVFICGIMASPTPPESEMPNIDDPSYSQDATEIETDDVLESESVTTESETVTEESTQETTNQIGKEDETFVDETERETEKETTAPVESEAEETSAPEDNVSDPSHNEAPSPVGNGVATSVNPAKLPAYSGNPFVVVDNNVPSFSSAELTKIGYESYSPLDGLGRCGVAIASCGKEIMPAEGEERGSISSIKPSGWVQAQYNGVSGGYLWNRCHLIGWQLSAENANKMNLITGTRYLNVEGMLPFENMIADYIKETDNHVAFRVTPIFEGNNLVCSGVQLEAYSIEDQGEGIQFNVYCYNVQPGIVIDYATGNSHSESQPDDNEDDEYQQETETESSSSTPETSAPVTEKVWVPKSGSKYHRTSTCSNMKNPSQITKEEAQQRGYTPCSKCY